MTNFIQYNPKAPSKEIICDNVTIFAKTITNILSSPTSIYSIPTQDNSVKISNTGDVDAVLAQGGTFRAELNNAPHNLTAIDNMEMSQQNVIISGYFDTPKITPLS